MVDLADESDGSFQRDQGAMTAPQARASSRRLPSDPSVHNGDPTRSASVASVTDQGGARVVSVDALRGFGMLFIIAGDGLAWALYDMSGDGQGPFRATAAFLSDQLR